MPAAVAAHRIQHDAHVDIPPMGGNHGRQQRWIGKDEHLDAQ
jgi:hypothetical protein